MRRSFSCGLVGIAVLAASPSAWAEDTLYVTRGPLCPLPYSPYSHEPATPAELVCTLDADDDGLDDTIENTIAECFTPQLRFDSAESWRRTFQAPPGIDPTKFAAEEPRARFHVTPQAATDRATIHYAFLWDEDGGYYDWYNDIPFLAPGAEALTDARLRNYHRGDAQGIDLGVRFVRESDRWFAELVSLGGARGDWTAGVVDPSPVTAEEYGWATSAVDDAWPLLLGNAALWSVRKYDAVTTRLRTLHADGTHPIVYASAGKHHFSTRTFAHQANSIEAGVLFFAEVAANHDRADGQGFAITPLAHSQMRLVNGALTDAYHNVGLLLGTADSSYDQILIPNRCAATRAELPAALWYNKPGPFVASESLPEVWGYQANFWSRGSFCGTTPYQPDLCDPEVSSLRALVTLPFEAAKADDADGDGLPNHLDPCPTIARTPDTADDPSMRDTDGDGLGDARDPAPNAVNRWVGWGGGLSHRAPYGVGKAFAPSSPWAGFLDADRDGRINGLDLCPDRADADKPAADNHNAWAETENFQSVGSTTSLIRYQDALIDGPPLRSHPRDPGHCAVLRGHIVRAGGADGTGHLRGDVVRFDAHTGQRSTLPGVSAEPFPARSLPALVWDADDQGLALGGGGDALGATHDDVYLLREGDAVATRIVPDSPPAVRVPLAAGSPLLVLGTERRAIRFGITADFVRENGSADGWQSESVARCGDAANSLPFRCGTTPFWQEPGARCEDSACGEAPATTLAATATLGGLLVIDAAPSPGTVWTVRANRLERYDASVPGRLTARGASALPGLGTVVCPPTGETGVGLVGHLRGVSLFRVGSISGSGNVQIDSPQAVCGRPIDITPIGPDRFAIATTVGLAIASRTPAGLTIEASGLVDAGGFVPVPRTPAGQARCLVAELAAGFSSTLVKPRIGSTVAASGAGIVLLRKSELLHVDTSGPTPRVTARTSVPGASHAVRVEGDTAYVAERNDGTRYDAIALTPRGDHDVGRWVRRRESGPLRLQQRFPTGLGTVEVAWTAP